MQRREVHSNAKWAQFIVDLRVVIRWPAKTQPLASRPTSV
jgi:hypothetical protein